MRLRFDFGLITIINSVIILEHLPATVIEKIPKSVAQHYNKIALVYEKNSNVHSFDEGMNIAFQGRKVVSREEFNNIINFKKLWN